MLTVKMPRASWEMVIFVLGKYTDNALMLSIWNEIQDQVYSGEY